MPTTVGGVTRPKAGGLAARRYAERLKQRQKEKQREAQKKEAITIYQDPSGQLVEPVATAAPRNYSEQNNYTPNLTPVATAAAQQQGAETFIYAGTNQQQVYKTVNTTPRNGGDQSQDNNPRSADTRGDSNRLSPLLDNRSGVNQAQTQYVRTFPEQRDTRQAQVQKTIESNTLFRKEGNPIQSTGYAVLAVIPTTANQFLTGIEAGTYLAKETLKGPERREQIKESFLAEGLPIFKEAPISSAESFSVLTREGKYNPEGLVNVALLTTGKKGPEFKPVENVKIQSGGKVNTVTSVLDEGTTLELSKSQLAVKAGRKAYLADVRSVAVTKPDAVDTFLRTERTEIQLTELSQSKARNFFARSGEPPLKNTKTSFARSDSQIALTETGAKETGTFSQVTNLGKNKAVQQQGVFGTIVQTGDDVTLAGTGVEFTKPTRTKPVTDIELLQYEDAAFANTQKGGLTVSQTRILVETEASLLPKLGEAAGVEVLGKTQPVPTTLSETFFEGVAGKKFFEFQKDLQSQGYTLTKTESGKPVLDLKGPSTSGPGVPALSKTLPVAKSPLVAEQVKQAVKNIATPAPTTILIPVLPTQQPTERTLLKPVKTTQTQTAPAAQKYNLLPAGLGAAFARVSATGAAAAQPRLDRVQKLSIDRIPSFSLAQKQLSGQALLSEQKTQQKQVYAQETQQIQETTTKTKSSFDRIPRFALTPKRKQVLVSVQGTQQEQFAVQDTLQLQETLTETKSTTSRTPAVPQVLPESTRLVIPFAKKDGARKKLIEGFDVLVREKGVFRRVNIFALPEEDALKLGVNVASNTAAASFKVVPTQREAEGRFSGFANLKDYSPSKREAGVLVQKREKRISSVGELKQITYKGIEASKRRFRL